jgi:hypothetical protein
LLCSPEDSRPEMVSVFPVTCNFTLFARVMSANCDASVDFSELAAGVAKGPAGFRFGVEISAAAGGTTTSAGFAGGIGDEDKAGAGFSSAARGAAF